MDFLLEIFKMHWRYPAFVSIPIAVIALMGSGCSQREDSHGTIVTGEVSFQGDPVPAGIVKLEPDASRGGRGRAYYAEISNGRYATEEFVPSGPMLLTITGYDGVEVGDSTEGLHFKMGTSLFLPYHTKEEIHESNAQLDFEIPLDDKRSSQARKSR
ncbi:hypothetical protein M4951_14465 [Blastopirellula sp. J2-11]|uniref:hypothetical protein n=1 Tax=Blastopirellula sp. J2-11 TaxID=2943192 RepID=UPI0021C97AAC|nr:hypothetical protein [Blastopirellula sp. J2-11]UUO04593.1 hypothetical protein M4951_14465 [Blastopirellula sp. J2-11]